MSGHDDCMLEGSRSRMEKAALGTGNVGVSQEQWTSRKSTGTLDGNGRCKEWSERESIACFRQ